MKALVIIPAYNEEGAIVETINNLKKSCENVDYVIINDCSKDRTLEICRKNKFNVINLPVNLGIGGAVQTGYKYAYENGYDVAIQMDADGQHNPKYIPQLITKIEEGNDFVIGSRFLEKEGFQSTFIRRMGINLYSWIIKVFTKKEIKDTTSGYRAAGKKIIKMFAQNYPVDYPEPETNAFIAKNNFKIIEIPMEMKERDSRSIFYYSNKINLLCC
ncbi:putative uncharacterized protein [Clostridium sp. CAG:343]|jgi:glycosyltransferase involved in cell wall biosynthesis|nr:putative uncharacterized protein [Clostridium sp. CAG:343]